MAKKKVFYISDVDLFLQAFDQDHSLSTSQQAEIKKHRTIAQQRDQANQKSLDHTRSKLWDSF